MSKKNGKLHIGAKAIALRAFGDEKYARRVFHLFGSSNAVFAHGKLGSRWVAAEEAIQDWEDRISGKKPNGGENGKSSPTDEDKDKGT